MVFIGAVGAAVCITLSLLKPTTPVWLLYLLSSLSGITLMGWMGIWVTLIGELSQGKSTGLGLGISFFFANLGLFLGPPLFGFLTDFFHTFFLSWMFLAFCMGMASFILLLAIRSSIQTSSVRE